MYMMDTNFDINSAKDYLTDFKNCLFKSKKYLLMYVILVVFASLTMFKQNNYASPKFELVMICVVVILGIIFLGLLFKYGDKELHKIAFVILIVFGLILCMMIPIDSVSDEGEHLVRAEMTSRGVLFPEYVNGSYETIGSIYFFLKSTDSTIFNINGDTKINYNLTHYDSAFEQNPFYGYIFSGLGMFFAKLLNLNAIWMLWLGRIFNMIFYASMVSYAIKKTPIFKVPLLFIACLPVCLFQACSLSIDSMLLAIGIYIIAYFFYMCENEFTRRDIIIFSILTLLCGLCKLPFLGLIFLLFFLPAENLKEDNKNRFYLYCIMGLIFVSVIGVLYSKYYAGPALYHSWRNTYMVNNNVSISGQVNFILNNPIVFTQNFFDKVPNGIEMFTSLFRMYSPRLGDEYVGSKFVSALITLFFGFICIGYPLENKIKTKARIGALFTFAVIYVGIYIVMLLSWSPVGNLKYTGIHIRYFLPLLFLLPFILAINDSSVKKDNIDRYLFVMIIFFISSMILSISTGYY